MATAQIPLQVARAILANREYFHELDRRAKARDPNMGFVTKPLELGDELKFWCIQDDETLDAFLTEDLLAALFGNEGIDWKRMPRGYEPLLLVLEFERHCAFEGWTAVSNKGPDEMRRIVSAYTEVGLVDEANALTRVMEAYVALGDDDHPDFHDILRIAYKSVPNATTDEFERVPVILAYVRNNPGLFSE